MRAKAPDEDELLAEWQAIDARRRQAAGPLFRDVRQMFRELAGIAEARIKQGQWIMPETPEGAERQGPDEGQRLTADNIIPFKGLAQEVRGVLSGLSDDEIEQLADTLGVTVEELGEHLQDNNIEALLRNGYQAATERLQADTNFVPSDPDVQAAMRQLNEKARGIAETTRQRMNENIREGIAENESVAQIRQRVVADLRRQADGDRDPDTDIDQSRARRIASTTTTTAFEKGQSKAFDDTGMVGKMWLSQRDVHVRPGHLEADGQKRPTGAPFDVRGKLTRAKEQLDHPGDPEGRAANVVNCRCSQLPIPDRETFEELESTDLSNIPALSDE